MESAITYSTTLKLNNHNQAVSQYIADYFPLFNQLQRYAYQRVKAKYKENGVFTLKDKNKLIAQLKAEHKLTSRALDSIVGNMVGRFESIKELKQYELKQLQTKVKKLNKEVDKLKDKRTLFKIKSSLTERETVEFKQLKQTLYHKQNRVNKLNRKIANLEREIEAADFKVCFGTKKLLQSDIEAFRQQRDSEIYFVGRAGDSSCNNNFQLTYNKHLNQFEFKLRKEIDLENGKFLTGRVHFNQKQTKVLKEILGTKSKALSYRLKRKDDTLYVQVMFKIESTKSSCLTRNAYGTIGVDFNKGFVSVSEINERGNLVNTFNLDYRFKSGNKTTSDFEKIAETLKTYCLNTGKDLVVEALNFNTKRAQQIKAKKNRGKKYNEMLGSLAYSRFTKIILSKCIKHNIYLHQVNPAWTSWIASQKYCPTMKLNIHTGASYVIARRGMSYKDKIK